MRLALVKLLQVTADCVSDTIRVTLRSSSRGIPQKQRDLLHIISNSFDQIDKEILDQHIAHIKFTDMSNPRICRYFLDKRKIRIAFPTGKYGNLLKVYDENKQELICHLTFYKGELFSLEFKGSWKQALSRKIELIRVSKGRAKDTFTREIDRAEHGKHP